MSAAYDVWTFGSMVYSIRHAAVQIRNLWTQNDQNGNDDNGDQRKDDSVFG
jgi:hypothetical protein